MREKITADPTITGAKGINRATTPKATTPKSSTGTTSGLSTNYALGLPDMQQVNQAESQLANNKALRNYQETQGALSLQNALRQIDRASLDAYKGVANNYAARGMLRSGGYVQADDAAFQATTDAKLSEAQKLKGLIDTNKMADTQDQQTRNNAIWDIISKFIGTEAANKLNEIKG